MMVLEGLFSEEIMDMTLFHIPHSSTIVPDCAEFDESVLNDEIELLTDHATDIIFDVDKVESIIFPYSRVYCDVERFADDEQEEMFIHGRGFYYTCTDSGSVLRIKEDKKQYILDKIYRPHHKRLESMVKERIKKYGQCFIVDCHSFSDKPFRTDKRQEANRPDVCIGVDQFHTPDYVIQEIKYACDKFGFRYEINNPFDGTMVPLKYYQKDDRVHSVMIELNRKLYMKDGIVNQKDVKLLKAFINSIYSR